jgi:hypothetical protein
MKAGVRTDAHLWSETSASISSDESRCSPQKEQHWGIGACPDQRGPKAALCGMAVLHRHGVLGRCVMTSHFVAFTTVYTAVAAGGHRRQLR